MNGFPRRRSTPVDLEELGRLLPSPADPDLPSDRHHLLREHLMSEIQQDPATSPDRRHRTRRRVAFTVAPLATLVAAAVAIIAVVGLAGPPTGTTHPGGTGTAIGSAPVTDAVTLLGRVSLASNDTGRTVRDDQFVYVESEVSFAAIPEGDLNQVTPLGPPHERQVWASVDGSKEGWLIEPENIGGAAGISLDTNTDPSLAVPTYQYLTTVPTDPDRLLALLHQQVRHDDAGMIEKKDPGYDLDQETFRMIGDLTHENLVPPRLAAALYRVAATIPGVTLVPDATDAAGRHGIAVSRTGPDGDRLEWIFDRKTYAYLGEREDNVKVGKPLGMSAVIRRGVVDHVKQLPK